MARPVRLLSCPQRPPRLANASRKPKMATAGGARAVHVASPDSPPVSHAAPTVTTASSSGVVRLNVGGVRYDTTLATLLAVPDSTLSMQFGVDPPAVGMLADDGTYMLDRDGPSFRYVLNFLRCQVSAADRLCARLAMVLERGEGMPAAPRCRRRTTAPALLP